MRVQGRPTGGVCRRRQRNAVGHDPDPVGRDAKPPQLACQAFGDSDEPARATCELIHEQGGLVYVPHPFARGKGGGGRILEVIAEHVDAVEGFNARLHDPALNGRAVAWALERSLPLGAGSDAHTLAEVGRAYVELPRFTDDPASFRGALVDATITGRSSSPMVHMASTYAKVRKRFSRQRASDD